MLALARGLLAGDGGEDAAREAVQTAWVRVIRHARTYRGDGDARSWLLAVTVNACRDEIARRRRERAWGLRLVRERPHEPSPPSAAHARPGDGWDAQLRAAVASLDAAKREAVVLCFGLGLTRERAAEVLRVPAGTVKTRIFHAMRELRERLAAWDDARDGQEFARPERVQEGARR